MKSQKGQTLAKQLKCVSEQSLRIFIAIQKYSNLTRLNSQCLASSRILSGMKEARKSDPYEKNNMKWVEILEIFIRNYGSTEERTVNSAWLI